MSGTENGAEPLWLAVAGKGGSGKTVVAGTLARILAGRGHDVVALDSDPMPGLARSLGIPEPAEPGLLGAAEKNEDGRWRLRPGIGPVRAVERFSVPAPGGVRLLQLGKANKEGLNRVLGSVNAFYAVAHRLAEAKAPHGWTIIGDLPAGPRHAAAGFAAYARGYIVVVEPSSQSVLTARRVARIARDHLDARAAFVANKVQSPEQGRRLERALGEPFAGTIPADAGVAAAERRGESPFDAAGDSAAVAAIEGLADAIEARTLFGVRSE